MIFQKWKIYYYIIFLINKYTNFILHQIKLNFYINLNKINKMLTDEEILKCKENGFILIGKTGIGKTSLLNIIFG